MNVYTEDKTYECIDYDTGVKHTYNAFQKDIVINTDTDEIEAVPITVKQEFLTDSLSVSAYLTDLTTKFTEDLTAKNIEYNNVLNGTGDKTELPILLSEMTQTLPDKYEKAKLKPISSKITFTTDFIPPVGSNITVTHTGRTITGNILTSSYLEYNDFITTKTNIISAYLPADKLNTSLPYFNRISNNTVKNTKNDIYFKTLTDFLAIDFSIKENNYLLKTGIIFDQFYNKCMEITDTYLNELADIIKLDEKYDITNIKYILSGCIDLTASECITGFTSGYSDIQAFNQNKRITSYDSNGKSFTLPVPEIIAADAVLSSISLNANSGGTTDGTNIYNFSLVKDNSYINESSYKNIYEMAETTINELSKSRISSFYENALKRKINISVYI